MDPHPTVLIADDFATTRLGVRVTLEREGFSIVGEAADGEEVIRALRQERVDLLVLDLGLPRISGQEIVDHVREFHAETKILIHTMLADEEAAARLFRAGIMAYGLKQDPPELIVLAAHRALSGKRWLSPSLSAAAIENAERLFDAPRDPLKLLSEREFEIMRLTAVGLSSRETGDHLGISPRTVEAHRANVLVKLGLKNHRELFRYALRRGIVR